MNKEAALKELNDIESKQKEIQNRQQQLRKIIEEQDNPVSIFERVSTFEDILRESPPSEDFRKLLSYSGTCIDMLPAKYSAICAKIIQVVNEGFDPDYSDSSQRKWRIWWEWNTGLSAFVFDYSGRGWSSALTIGGSRFAIKDEKCAIFIGKTFAKDFNNLLTLKK